MTVTYELTIRDGAIAQYLFVEDYATLGEAKDAAETMLARLDPVRPRVTICDEKTTWLRQGSGQWEVRS